MFEKLRDAKGHIRENKVRKELCVRTVCEKQAKNEKTVLLSNL